MALIEGTRGQRCLASLQHDCGSLRGRHSPLHIKAACSWFWVHVDICLWTLLEIYKWVWMQIIPAGTLIYRGIPIEGAMLERGSLCARKFGLAHWLFSRSLGKWVDAASHEKQLSPSCYYFLPRDPKTHAKVITLAWGELFRTVPISSLQARSRGLSNGTWGSWGNNLCWRIKHQRR